jgi:hypothetical protein
MLKGGESLGNKESSKEEEEVIPANESYAGREATRSRRSFPQHILLKIYQNRRFERHANSMSTMKRYLSP